MSDEAKAARWRRQARLRERGNERLSRITGSAGASFQKDSAPPKPSRPALIDLGTANKSEDPLESFPASTHDIISRFQNSIPQPKLDSDVVQSQPPKRGTQTTTKSPPQRKLDRSQWLLIHLTTIILTSLFYIRAPGRLFNVFIAMELGLYATQRLIEHQPPPTMFTPFLAYMPANMQRNVRSILWLWAFLANLYQDLCVIIFVYGVFQMLGFEPAPLISSPVYTPTK